jgi:hypothetical protein
MNELSIEKMEMVSGGCSFDEMMFYSFGQGYHLHALGGRGGAYHLGGVMYYTSKLFGCM